MFNRNYYFDIGALPLDPQVAAQMRPFLTEEFGNPESIHQSGQQARRAVETARAELAQLIEATAPAEIIFVSCATEADNLAIKGVAMQHWRDTKGQLRKKQLLVSPIEHPAVREAAKGLQDFGFEVHWLKVDGKGQIDLQDLRQKINDQTLLVSVIAANNQFGTIADLQAIGECCRANQVYFHTDAAVYFGLNELQVQQMKIDLATLSSTKIYGPQGAAALYCRSGISLYPLLHGGGQEHGRRSGTHNLAAIVGFVAAAKRAMVNMEKNRAHYQALSDYFIEELKKSLPQVLINGDPQSRLVNNVHLSILGVEGESLVLALSHFGICASSGSACSSQKLEADPSLKALCLKPEAVHGSLRFFWHEWTTQADLDYLLEKLIIVVQRLRQISAYKVEQTL